MASEGAARFREVLSKRYEVLDCLSAGAKTKAELDAELSASRSTVDRAVRELLNAGSIEPTEVGERRFRLTSVGALAIQVEDAYREQTDRLDVHAALLNRVPSDAPLSADFVRGADVYESGKTPDVAHRPADENIGDASKMMGTATVVHGHYFETLLDRVEAGGFELELVLEASLQSAIAEHYAEEFATLREHEAVELAILSEPIPYALWMLERDAGALAGVTIHDDGGVRGTIANETPSAVSWARTQYQQYRDAATPLGR